MSLKEQAISGVIWTILDTFVLRGLSFIATIILARWLGPDDFGLMGMIAVFIALGNSITDSGLSTSLIRTKNADEKDYSTVFILNLMLSMAVYIVLFFSAPFIADFFRQEILTEIIRVYCFSFIISAFSAVQIARLTSNLQFKKITKFNIPAIVISTILGLILGWYGFGIWALVWMNLSNQLIKTITLWFGSNWTPTLNYSKEKAAFHYTFGYKLMLSGILDTSFRYLYNILIGKFYTLKDLGFYERAKTFNDYPVQTLTMVVSKVTYPLLSSISDDKVKLGKVYRQIFGVTFFVTAPLMFGLSAIAEPLFIVVLGEAWIGAVPFFQILCMASMFYPIHAFNLNIFQVFGRSDLFLKLEIIKKITVVLVAIISFQFGIYGLVWGSVFVSILALLINTHYTKDLIDYSGKRQFIDLFPTYIISLLMFLMIKLALYYLSSFNHISQIVFVSVGAILFYLLVSFITKNQTFILLLNLLKEKHVKI